MGCHKQRVIYAYTVIGFGRACVYHWTRRLSINQHENIPMVMTMQCIQYVIAWERRHSYCIIVIIWGGNYCVDGIHNVDSATVTTMMQVVAKTTNRWNKKFNEGSMWRWRKKNFNNKRTQITCTTKKCSQSHTVAITHGTATTKVITVHNWHGKKSNHVKETCNSNKSELWYKW